MNLLVAEKFQQSAQLSDAHPLDEIDMRSDRRIGFAGKCGGDDFLYAGFTRRIGEQSADKRHCPR